MNLNNPVELDWPLQIIQPRAIRRAPGMTRVAVTANTGPTSLVKSLE